MYSPEPSLEVILMSPARCQNACHQARCSSGAAFASAGPRLASVVSVPLWGGQATITRKWPSGAGLKVTVTVLELLTAAETSRPVAVTAARAPKVCPEAPGP